MTHRREGALAWWASSGEVVRALLRWFLKSSFSRAFIDVWVSMDKIALPIIANRPCPQVWCMDTTLNSAAEQKKSAEWRSGPLRPPLIYSSQPTYTGRPEAPFRSFPSSLLLPLFFFASLPTGGLLFEAPSP